MKYTFIAVTRPKTMETMRTIVSTQAIFAKTRANNTTDERYKTMRTG
jgi:hypothetical protein